MSILVKSLLLAALASQALAGPITYGLCQTDCNVIAEACYTAAGATFGTVVASDASPAVLACNAALGTCATACAKLTLGS